MIVEMKKVVLICLARDKDSSLDALRDLGVLHLTPVSEPRDPDLAQSRKELAEARSILNSLAPYAGRKHDDAPAAGQQPGAEILARARDLLNRKQQTAADLNALRIECQALEPYGDFDPAAVRAIAERGVVVKLFYVGDKKPVTPPDGTHLALLSSDARGQCFAIVGMDDFEFAAPEFPLPKRSLTEAVTARDRAVAEQNEIEQQLTALGAQLPALRSRVAELDDSTNYLQAAAGMGFDDRVAYLQGFCPVDGVPAIQSAAARNGWGLLITDPAAGDSVPTLVRNRAWVRPINILFDMLDILPGYHEVDIRSVFLIFLTLFFAILVGDAGYGLIFLAITFFARRKFRDAPSGPFRLGYLLSICTIVWGAITGNYFGILSLPAPLRRFEIPWMKNDHNLMALSFLIGAIHLTIARAWAALRMIKSTRALAQLGWICLSWCMYFLARSLILGMALPGWFTSLFVAGLALLILFMTPIKHLKTDWADHVMLPFDVIGNFADVVSYVRLFAVGSAGLAVAIAFNELAVGTGIETWAGGLKAAVILFLGHALNIILCLMSILVHGVRLNTLEFSRHIGLEWGGFKYQPFVGRGATQPEK